MTYLMNTWYCAGWSNSVDDSSIVSITMLGRSLVMFRDENCAIAALDNQCPHRFAPLDRGQLCSGQLKCGYHGLVFDRTGKCVSNPHSQGFIPAGAQVRSYPAEERFGAIWLWMGDDAPDPSLIPDFEALDPATAFVGQRYLHAKANYQLDVDNILDLSHIQYLHSSTLGSDSVSGAEIKIRQEGNTVYCTRLMTNERLTPFLERAFFVEPGQAIDRGLEVRWDAPASMLLTVWVTPTGRPASEGHTRKILHVFTPETETSSHYWFALAYPKSMGPEAEAMAIQGVAGLAVPFETEDLPMLEAQQAMIGDRDFWSLRPVILQGDAGAVRARRVLQKLIRAERARMPIDARPLPPVASVEDR